VEVDPDAGADSDPDRDSELVPDRALDCEPRLELDLIIVASRGFDPSRSAVASSVAASAGADTALASSMPKIWAHPRGVSATHATTATHAIEPAPSVPPYRMERGYTRLELGVRGTRAATPLTTAGPSGRHDGVLSGIRAPRESGPCHRAPHHRQALILT